MRDQSVVERLQFEQLVSDLAARSINAAPAEIDQEIEKALQAIVDFFHVSQCALIKGVPEEQRAVITHAARAGGASPVLVGVDVVPLFPWTSVTLRRSERVRVANLDDLPAEAAVDREACRTLGVRSMLAIPLSFEGSARYTIAVSSRDEERVWPEEYIPRLQLIGEILVNATERKRARAELEERLRFETLLADLSTRFVALAPDQIDGQIEHAQSRVCELFGIDRSILWEGSPDSRTAYLSTHVSHDQVRGTPPPKGLDAMEIFPWMAQKALGGQTLVLQQINNLPPEAARDLDTWRRLGIKSLVVVPLSEGTSRVFGALSFAQIREERTWPETMVSHLKLIAQVLANALSRKQADEALRKSEERLSLAARAAKLSLWSLELATQHLWHSEGSFDILGLDRSIELTQELFFRMVHPEDRERLRRIMMEAVTSIADAVVEYRIIRPDGTLRWVMSRARPYVNASGEPERLTGVSFDITERKKLEALLRQAQKMEAIGTLSGGIAHDFNNILAAMIGFTELVKDKLPQGSENERYLKMVMEAGLRGRKLIRQMLTFSHQTPREKKPLQLSAIVNETSSFLRASIPTTISIRVNIESDSGPVLGDPVEMQQVLMNLCTNAEHAMRGKGGTIDIELSDFYVSVDAHPGGMEPGLYTRVVVRDTGVGIAPDIMDKIFDPYFTTKKVGEGSGLGLSTVMGIVKQSHGSITVESTPGTGSTFTVYLPQVGGRAIIDEVVTVEPIPTGSERILFVDDEALVVMMGEALLAELGYEVTSRTKSREALELFKNDPFRFDLVITDQTMPDMTGIQLAKEVLAIRSDIPVILCTGFSYIVDGDSAKAAGIRDFATKPLTKEEIARTIRQVLDG